MSKVYLSPSNQDNNVGYGNYGTEKARMIELAEKVREKLVNNFEVKMANYDSTLASRAIESNKWNSDIYVALHSNAGGGRGCEVFAYSTASKGNILAHCIYNQLSAVTLTEDRGVKYNSLYETKTPNAPAVLIECIFHDNKDDVEWYLNNIDNVATAIAKGIYEYFNVEYSATVVENPIVQSYTYEDFDKDLLKIVAETVTVSRYKNKNHAVVKPIQKYLYSLGYTEVGEADGDAGVKFDTAIKHYQKENGCVADGEITANGLTWKKLLKLA